MTTVASIIVSKISSLTPNLSKNGVIWSFYTNTLRRSAPAKHIFGSFSERISFSAVVAERALGCRFSPPTIVEKYKSRLKKMSRTAWGRGVCLQSHPRRQKHRKPPRPLVPGKVKIMKNTHRLSQRYQKLLKSYLRRGRFVGHKRQLEKDAQCETPYNRCGRTRSEGCRSRGSAPRLL